MIPYVISQDGLDLIKKFEGLHKLTDQGDVRSYRCPAGKWTIGYGHTRGVKSGMRASAQECEQFLQEDVKASGDAVRSAVNVPLSQHQYDALVSFVFNCGPTAFRNSTLLKKLNKGLYHEVPEQIVRWNKARVDGELTVLRGLTRRRSAEAALWAMDAPLAGQEGGDLMPQRPVQTAQKPLTRSKTLAGAGAASIGTIGSVLGEAATNLESIAAYSDSIQSVFLALTVIGIALVTYSRIKDHNEGER